MSDIQYPHFRLNTFWLLPQVTLLREYCQGVNEMQYVLPTGSYDPDRHTSPTAAGQAELSEEVRRDVSCISTQFQIRHMNKMIVLGSRVSGLVLNVKSFMTDIKTLT